LPCNPQKLYIAARKTIRKIAAKQKIIKKIQITTTVKIIAVIFATRAAAVLLFFQMMEKTAPSDSSFWDSFKSPISIIPTRIILLI